ncbi:MAG: hypothetical protein ACFFDI_14575 [Promethearchaeota archaeon]
MKKRYILVSGLIIGLLLLFSIRNDSGTTSNIRNERYKEDSPLPFASIITPYTYEENVTACGAYSDTEDCPWEFIHQGFDIMTFNNTPFQAVADCNLTEKDKFYNTGNGKWQANLRLDYNSDVWFRYAFEPFSANESHIDQQLAMIPHTEGTQLKQGDVIGTLLTVGAGAHVCWSIQIYDISVCPAPYFTPEAYQSVLNLIKEGNPSWEMCYCNCSPIFLIKTNTVTNNITITNTITNTITTVVRSSWPLIVLPTLVIISILILRKRRIEYET